MLTVPHIQSWAAPDSNWNQQYSCPNCFKVYRWMISLRRHMRLECGKEGNLCCSICSRRFKHKHHLVNHLGVHRRRDYMASGSS
ncbi:zinc finger protein 319-like [Schistocerca americana]|uniref:zinc finger protein 319-like n=1 Tax=Schistocerca americana TaxID=7009 RepID=UPI001F4F7AC6|nr:zinc finger protein 319-like [Schistocerca americana]XP_049810924.1 zinc finger protein 319-like [Schistocerca nitens]